MGTCSLMHVNSLLDAVRQRKKGRVREVRTSLTGWSNLWAPVAQPEVFPSLMEHDGANSKLMSSPFMSVIGRT